jgi:hypothetical protein
MSKNKFIGLIFMMLLSLTGIIWVQIVWIRNAVSILNENFNRAVIASLNDAANTIESNRRMSFFNDFMFNDQSIPESSSGDITSYLSVGSYSSTDGKKFSYSVTSQSVTGSIDSSGNVKFNPPVVSHNDTTFLADSGTYIISSPEKPGELNVIRNNDGINTSNRSLNINRQEFLDWVKRRASEFRNMSDQMISEIYQWEKTMQVDKNEIGFALRNSFLFSRIETPFEFAVIKNGVVEDGTFKKSDKNDFLKSNYMVRLFPDNIIRQDRLSVIFPDRTNYVLGSMTWLWEFLLFSLIILATLH